MGEDIAHGLGGFQLGVSGDVGVGVQCEARRVVAQHTAVSRSPGLSKVSVWLQENGISRVEEE